MAPYGGKGGCHPPSGKSFMTVGEILTENCVYLRNGCTYIQYIKVLNITAKAII